MKCSIGQKYCDEKRGTCLCTPELQEMDNNDIVNVSSSKKKKKICYPEDPRCGGGGKTKPPVANVGKDDGKEGNIY